MKPEHDNTGRKDISPDLQFYQKTLDDYQRYKQSLTFNKTSQIRHNGLFLSSYRDIIGNIAMAGTDLPRIPYLSSLLSQALNIGAESVAFDIVDIYRLLSRNKVEYLADDYWWMSEGFNSTVNAQISQKIPLERNSLSLQPAKNSFKYAPTPYGNLSKKQTERQARQAISSNARKPFFNKNKPLYTIVEKIRSLQPDLKIIYKLGEHFLVPNMGSISTRRQENKNSLKRNKNSKLFKNNLTNKHKQNTYFLFNNKITRFNIKESDLEQKQFCFIKNYSENKNKLHKYILNNIINLNMGKISYLTKNRNITNDRPVALSKPNEDAYYTIGSNDEFKIQSSLNETKRNYNNIITDVISPYHSWNSNKYNIEKYGLNLEKLLSDKIYSLSIKSLTDTENEIITLTHCKNYVSNLINRYTSNFTNLEYSSSNYEESSNFTKNKKYNLLKKYISSDLHQHLIEINTINNKEYNINNSSKISNYREDNYNDMIRAIGY